MLRFANLSDAAELLAIYRPYVEQTTITFEYETPSLEEFSNRMAAGAAAGYPWIVAQHAGKLLGYAYAHPYAQRAAYQWSVETSIYLDQAARRLGVGRKLYRALMALCRLQGCREMWAIVTDPNPASNAFHKACGFTDCGLLPHIGYKRGQWLGVRTWHYELIQGDDAPAPVVPAQMLNAAQVEQIWKENA